MEQDWYKDAVIYGVEVSAFFDADGDGVGDFRGLISKLDYFVGLGVTCLWLLPFYPTPHKDNGYDITNHVDVDPRLGTLGDFRTFMYACKEKGLRVIVDLVIHHTSTSHPWFIASSNDRPSKYKDYYLWREQISPSVQTGNAFPTIEDGVWTYEENAHTYYRHQFYHFEPDLNIANKDVQFEINNIIDFWLAFGVDGFRVDAAAHVLNQKGMLGGGTDDTFEFFENMRSHIAGINPEAVLIGEADVPFKEIPDYFGNNTRLQMLYNFLLNNQMFLSLATQSADAIKTCLKEQRTAHGSGVWVNFIRNLDELNLMHLDKVDQQKVMGLYAPEPSMNIFDRGIRRRLPTMLQGNMRQIKMAYSLLFALPGVPMFVYGEEIGMGDNLSQAGRNSVRIPMQWDTSRNGGFSAAEDTVLPVRANEDEVYGYSKVNVAAEAKRKDSLLNFFKELIALRRDMPRIGHLPHKVLNTENKQVIGLYYKDADDGLLILHNMSDETQRFTMPKEFDGLKRELVFGETIGHGELAAFGFSWQLVKS